MNLSVPTSRGAEFPLLLSFPPFPSRCGSKRLRLTGPSRQVDARHANEWVGSGAPAHSLPPASPRAAARVRSPGQEGQARDEGDAWQRMGKSEEVGGRGVSALLPGSSFSQIFLFRAILLKEGEV